MAITSSFLNGFRQIWYSNEPEKKKLSNGEEIIAIGTKIKELDIKMCF